MHVSIDDRWARFAEKAVQEGQFESVGEVVAAGLRLLEESQIRLADLRGVIAEGLESDDDLSGPELDAFFDGLGRELTHERI